MLPEASYEVEEAPASLQRMWNLARARSTGTVCIPELTDTLEPFEPTQEFEEPIKKHAYVLSDLESDAEELFSDHESETQSGEGRRYKKWRSQEPLILDAATLGDLPAVYKIAPLSPHQFPVVGVYIDPRVNVGFKYKVKPLSDLNESSSAKALRYLFNGKALALKSIGRGYSRRFTFDSEGSSLNNNENYFWGDSRPEGFAFEIEVVSIGDKFTIFNPNNVPEGALEVVQIQKDQLEFEQTILGDGTLEKKVKIYVLCKVEWYEKSRETPLIPVTGLAIVRKNKRDMNGSVAEILNVAIGTKSGKKGYLLKPGVQSSLRRLTVNGETISDIPTKYTIVGLEHYELPVIGTYIDPRIISGFHYRVRMVGSKRHFFQGRSLLLQSVGMGYGKRLTFTPDSFNTPENFFWSDSHPSGFGLEPRAVHSGMRFRVSSANDEHLGEASVFRADLPQIEEKTELVKLNNKSKKAVDKHIQIDVSCHVTLATTGGGTVDSEVHLMRVSGVALVRKNPDSATAKLIKVYNVGLDSQLNQLFVQSQTELTFHPIP